MLRFSASDDAGSGEPYRTKEGKKMVLYGFLMTALIVSLAAWGLILWTMTQSVYSASVVTGDFARLFGDEFPEDEERTERKRMNAFYKYEVQYHRAA
jgi:hypothetical protein